MYKSVEMKMSSGKRLLSLCMAVLMLLTMLFATLPMQAMAYDTGAEVTLYANNPNSSVASKKVTTRAERFGGYDDEGNKVPYKYVISLRYNDFEVPGNYTIKGYNTKPDGSGKTFNMYSKQYIDNDITELYAQWMTGFEGREVKLHADTTGVNPSTKIIKTDKHGVAKLSSLAFTKPNSTIYRWHSESGGKGVFFEPGSFDGGSEVNLRKDLNGVYSKKTDSYEQCSTDSAPFTDLYASWIGQKNIAYKDNAGKTYKTEDFRGVINAYGTMQWSIYCEGPSTDKMVVGFTTKPNGAGDWYVPEIDYFIAPEKYNTIPDVLYAQEIAIPNYDYLMFLPLVTSAKDAARFTKKYEIVKFDGGVMPLPNVFGGGTKITYWSAHCFDWAQEYESCVPFSEYSRIVPNKAGAQPWKYPSIIFGHTDEKPVDENYTVTSVSNADGSRETTTEKIDGSVITLKEYRDGRAEGTSKMANGVIADTTITSGGEITVNIDVPEDFTDVYVHGKDMATEVALPKSKTRNPIKVEECYLDGTPRASDKRVAGQFTLKFHVYEDCIVNLVPDKSTFKDVEEGSWYSDSVDDAVSRGLFNGKTSNDFAPHDNLDRGMFVTVIWRLENEPTAGENSFVDVSSGSYYEKPASWAFDKKIVEGIGNGKFGPGLDITREALVTMMFRYAKSIGVDATAEDCLSDFSDSDLVSTWAVEAMNWAVASGIIRGTNGEINPQGNATRAQAAAIVERFVKEIVSKTA